MARTQVQSELIATNAISGTIIADGAITSTHLAANCVDSSELVTGSIDTIHIAANQVTSAKIVSDAVLTRHISDNQVTGDKLTDNITIAGTLTSTGAFTGSAGATVTGLVKATQSAANYAGHFESTNANSYGVWIEESASPNNGYPLLGITNDGGSSTYFRVDSGTGNVGIGTSSPTFSAGSGLEISRAGPATLRLEDTDGTTGATELVQVDADGYLLTRQASSALIFGINSSEKMRLASSGALGIGTSSPQDYIEIDGSGSGLGGLTISNSTHNHAALSFARSGAATARIYITEPDATHTSQMYFQTSDASGSAANLVTAMSINEAQNVGIGVTSNLDRTLTVTTGLAKTSTTTAYPFAIQSSDGSNAGRFSMHYTGGADAGARKLYMQMEEEGVANDGDIHLNPHGGGVQVGSTGAVTSGVKLEVGGKLYVPSHHAQAGTALIGEQSGYAMFGSNSSSEPVLIARDFSTNYKDIEIATDGTIGYRSGSTTGMQQNLFNNGYMTLADDATFDIDGVANVGCMIVCQAWKKGTSITYPAAVFFFDQLASGSVTEMADPQGAWSTSDSDGSWNIFHNGNTNIRIKNRTGTSNRLAVTVFRFQGV